ncbi:RNA pseudouridylate synthase domain-containing protein 1-like [Pieris napi]|uniref:Pseudouridine synthase RsuA/RluA-like domain-containing protein n=1 Tax=Pieris macdunnoughi TaxID=345717 RepID=A0A821VVD5_9NEOP|nr:RNA pseudouridylate synthase domain-containing protein 1-like [Pieris napi]CAF4913256.1 unnamed protein product [Pieris macdunnoughi]
MAVDKLYECEDFLVVNKPYDMYINSDDENEKNTVTCHIASHDSHLSTSSNPLYFIQRLDYSTSGVLCIAKNKTTAGLAGKLFEKRLTKKYYLAIVRGHPEFQVAEIRYAVGVDQTPDHGHRMSVVSKTSIAGDARPAHTRLLLLETGYYCGQPVAVVLLKPITGRRHQLRIHCHSASHTILGDYTYSDRTDTAPHRMFLHAIRLVLPLPHKPLDIQTAEPFFSDSKFSSKWKSHRVVYKYRSKEELLAACDDLDREYIVGVKYKDFSV